MMVGVLSHTNQLNTFTERAFQISEETDVSPLLVTRISKMMEYVMNDSSGSRNGLSRVFDWNIEMDTRERICLPGIGSFRFEHAEFTLAHFVKERKQFLEVARKAPTPGWSLLMTVIWGQLSVAVPTGQSITKQWLQLREISFRYLLAIRGDEDLFFPSLCGDVHLRFTSEWHQASEDDEDTKTIMDMFAKKMTLPPGVLNTPELPLSFLSTLSDWVSVSIIKHKTRQLLPTFFNAVAGRVWADLGSSEPMNRERWCEIPPYVFGIVRHLQALFLGKFGQDDPATAIPMFASVLRDINHIDLIGRMLMMPMSAQARSAGLWSTRKLQDQWEDGWVTMSFFSHTLSNFNPSSRATLIDLYQPWANTWFQLTMNKSKIPARDPVRLFITHCEKVWLELGDALRFLKLRDELWVSCMNPRCYSPKNDGGAQWVCVKCMKASYCSVKCQNE
ncbi:hypothetical protein BDV93DRAFT_315490 [Ceratobasidium sp. AG-I]|nr:hypothetical protein BDV93DRAFT_315490 [Ceratobasidium sp. AG-I]